MSDIINDTVFRWWWTEHGGQEKFCVSEMFKKNLRMKCMWFLAFQSSNIVVKIVFDIEDLKIEKILNIFFRINLFLVIIQIVIMCIDMRTWLPFSSMSAGDNIKWLFRNSSVNMVVMSFYAVFYMFKKDHKNTIIAFSIMILTFYMNHRVLTKCLILGRQHIR